MIVMDPVPVLSIMRLFSILMVFVDDLHYNDNNNQYL